MVMAEIGGCASTAQLDIEHLFVEAQSRWLRPPEICKILQNYKIIGTAPEPPNRPPSGAVFLFDRNVLRHFRKDGHNWRKNKDGRTAKEAHERLKLGSVDILHCYYSCGEDKENIHRRSYWMLEEELSHIAFVHYLEVKGNRENFNWVMDADGIPASQKNEEVISNTKVDGSAASVFQPYDNQRASPITDTTGLNTTQASEREQDEPGIIAGSYRHQTSLGFQSIHELQTPAMQTMDVGSIPYHPVPVSNIDQILQEAQHRWLRSAEICEILQNYKKFRIAPEPPNRPHSGSLFLFDRKVLRYFRKDGYNWRKKKNGKTEKEAHERLKAGSIDVLHCYYAYGEDNENFHRRSYWMIEEELSHIVLVHYREVKGNRTNYNRIKDADVSPASRKNEDISNSEVASRFQPYDYQRASPVTDTSLNSPQASEHEEAESAYTQQASPGFQSIHESQLPALQKMDIGSIQYHPFPISNDYQGQSSAIPAMSFESISQGEESKELGDVTEPTMQPGSGSYWETVGNEDDSGIATQVPLDNYFLGPSLSQDQLFSIIDFSPNWAYSRSEIKVLIMGKFLRSQEELDNYKWACMFGELEVPAEIVGDGVLCCHTPVHGAGRFPFYITCSNRLACSEVREFEFQPSFVEDEDSDETRLHMRFGKLLSLGSGTPQISVQSIGAETSQLCSKIGALLKDDTEWEQMLSLSKQDQFSADKVKDQLLQKLLKEKLHNWLLQKIVEGGKGPNVLDEDGQGVLHFAAALGYDWAIPPTIAAGVSVNFRDANGWTALHWAASYGREHTVGFLISSGAAPGLLTDPSPIHPSGRTPADLAASNGHKGIAGYLAESALSSHLIQLDLEDSGERNIREKAVETVSERIATPVGVGDLPHGLSMKDSLAAVRNATQAAARIHQAFRVKSFQRKQLKECGDSEFGISDERALSLLAPKKTKKAGQRDEPVQAAAIRIQNKFRSWKGRKDFLLIRQRIIKIQAHVRGHQVRKNYKKIIWSVGILDKIILRWRRKGRGLSGFKPEAPTTSTSMVDAEVKEDDYDFLKEGRKQTEQRLQKALARVKSMVQYPEARDQYRRLLNVVSEIQDKKAAQDQILNSPEVYFDEELIDIEALMMEDDIYVPTTS